MPPVEPSLATLPSPVLRHFVATRPAFLSVTFVGVLVGVAVAAHDGVPVSPLLATVTMFFALVAQGGANVLNDYYDAQNGTDAANVDRVFPFTGGSRIIQNGVMTAAEAGRFGFALMAAVVLAGLWLTSVSGAGLIAVGLAGLVIAWAYSAPPLHLVARGLGEAAITAAWLLVVIGADYVQRGAFDFAPVAAGLGFALLVANVLFINQFPDIRADAVAGKRTVVVRLGPAAARHGYLLIALLAYGWVAAMTVSGDLPAAALLSLLPAAVSFKAAAELRLHAANPSALTPAIKMTILAASLHGLLLAATLAFAG